MKSLFAVLICLAGSSVFAQDAYIDPSAATICSQQTFDSAKRQCLDQVKGERFDSQVIDICARQTFDSDKLTCLKIIANKRFLAAAEVQICRTQTFDSSKRECLSKAATAPINGYMNAPSYSLSHIDQQLYFAIGALQMRDYIRAEALLEGLRYQIRLMQKNGAQ